jgi:hypothetical protein
MTDPQPLGEQAMLGFHHVANGDRWKHGLLA